MNGTKSNEVLDTNTCIRYINGRAPEIRLRMQKISDEAIAISTVTKGEMYSGAAKSNSPQRSCDKQDAFFSRFSSIPFDDVAADMFGRIRAKLQLAGTPIGPYDIQIAAIALAHKLILVTHNTREFVRVAGLSIEDWEIPHS